jgi:hypothetical protein
VDEDQNVGKGGQRETAPGQDQYRDTEEDGRHLQHPGEPVVSAHGRERETEASEPQEEELTEREQ